MKLKNILAITTLTLGTTLSALSQTGHFGEYFTHQCRDTNQVYNYSYIYNPTLNGDSTALAIFTPHSLTGGIDDNFHCGLWYNKTINRWAIYNENTLDSVSLLSGFNVLVPTANGTIFKHTATPSNISGYKTLIDNPATNGKPKALLFISHNWGTSGGVYNNRAVGVYYDQAAAKWGLFNEIQTNFPNGATYNVFVVENPGANAFIHTTGTPSPSTKYLSYLDNPYINENDTAILFVTHNLSPGGITNNKVDTSSVGVAQKSMTWLVYNRDKTVPIDSGTTFNILIANSLPVTGVHNTEATNSRLQVYPNPAAGVLNVEYEVAVTGTVAVKLYSIEGRCVSELTQPYNPSGTFTAQIPLNDLLPGVYLLDVNIAGHKQHRQVVVTK